ncbi:MFS transporter [Alteromonas sp. PRIM-21]|uniref:MFS transporter n=1 Tax=Alteromonas sp. PRIM-21 TaxID=1454978 RepID=UPI0022B9BBCE|nr:MFS transporter [Alteromonas sp. PRIM-21]MCZ8531333.1 MFS transporter [Alteromonas sp. PRIM-21]
MKHTMSRKAFYSLTVTFTILSVLGQVSTSIYSPFFFDLATMYGSQVRIIEQSVAVFLVAFSISQLASGIVCDYISKQSFLFCGILVFIAGTLMVALASEESTFLIGRVVQGLGGGVGVSVSRGLSRQIFSEKQLNTSLSLINIAFAIAPAIAPLIGTIIGESLGISAIFYFVLVMGLLALLLLFSVSSILRHFTPPVSDNVFSYTLVLIKSAIVKLVSVGMASGLLYGVVFCFLTIAPSMVMQQFGLSKTLFSVYSLLATLSFVVGSVFNIWLKSLSPLQKFRISSLCLAAFSVLFALTVFLNIESGLVSILAYCYITFFFIGIAMPCSVTIMLGYSETSAGFLAALTGFFHLTGAAIGAYAVTLLTLEPTEAFSIATCALSIASIAICFTLKKD